MLSILLGQMVGGESDSEPRVTEKGEWGSTCLLKDRLPAVNEVDGPFWVER